MLERYLFKAKRKNWKELWQEDWWVIGYYVFCRKHHYILPIYSKVMGYDERFNEWIEVDESTLCQCTGLCDKNKRYIWENDICDRGERFPEIVNYSDGDWQLDYSYVFGNEKGSDACNLGFYVTERKSVEVIGNIFDDFELLEVMK